MTHLLLAIIYISFISLGLPDALLGSAWPTVYPQFDVPVSYAGIVSMIIAAGTIISSLFSDRILRRFGVGTVTAFSVATTAAALFGFSFSRSFPALCLWALPYGLGAGSVDAGLNNYVAVHYTSRHMSWLHCMWGTGATLGPYVMGLVLTRGLTWNLGYRIIGVLQLALTAALFASLSLWKTAEASGEDPSTPPLSMKQVLALPGAKAFIAAFFCYCAIENTAGLWASSYLVLHHGMAPDTAAGFASLFYLGLTAGRGINGFLTFRFSDRQLIRLGAAIIGLGAGMMLLPAAQLSAAGLVVAGIGCAPIYPCMIHSTPDHFGAGHAQSLIGIQMASAYVGTCLMPPLFGLIANHISVALLPVFLLIALAVMAVMHAQLCRRAAHR